jgi:tRNA A37 threonylcarbamoyladenosine modification protein TsaB
MMETKEYSLVISGSYREVFVSVCTGEQMLVSTSERVRASAHLLRIIETTLSCAPEGIESVSKIIVDCGPGSSSSLRSVLTTANGLGAALKIPLYSSDGLAAIAEDVMWMFSSYGCRVVLLNAFGGQLHYRIEVGGRQSPLIGCAPLDDICEMVAPHVPKRIVFAGSGAMLYKKELAREFGAAKIAPLGCLYPSAEALVTCADKEPVPFLREKHAKTLEYRKLDEPLIK